MEHLGYTDSKRPFLQGRRLPETGCSPTGRVLGDSRCRGDSFPSCLSLRWHISRSLRAGRNWRFRPLAEETIRHGSLFFSDCAVKLVISLLYTYIYTYIYIYMCIYINRYRYYIYIHYTTHSWFFGSMESRGFPGWSHDSFRWLASSAGLRPVSVVSNPFLNINTPQSKSWFCDRFFLAAQSWGSYFFG